MASCILVVEDDATVAKAVTLACERVGLSVVVASTGVAALREVSTRSVDAIVLDLWLPDIDGLDVCRRLRELGMNTPLLILSARADEVDRIVGLEAGADDYMIKPFSPAELAARIRALLRRTHAPARRTDILEVGRIRIERGPRRAIVAGSEVTLTRVEFDILATLASRAGDVVTRRELVETVWGYSAEGETRLLDVHISHLRKKLGDDPVHPRLVVNVRGVGYALRTR
jgi:DNA-binding response OmpR family regulator